MQPHPLSVMSDPRVCRGSIVAKRREENARLQAEEQRRRAEKRYRTELMRNRLSMIIPGAMTSGIVGNGQSRSPILPLRQEQRFDGGTGSHHELARLAGPLRRRVGVAQIPAQRQQQRIESKVGTKTQLDADQTPFPRLPLINSSTTKQKPPTGIGDSSDDFGGVQFLPFRSTAADAITSPAKVIPIMSTRSGEGSTGIGLLSPTPATAPPLPRLTMRQGAVTKRTAKIGGTGRRLITWSDVSSPLNPPPSAAGAPIFADIAIQTEEERAFEEMFAPLVREMVAGAVYDAQRSLVEEEEMRRVEEYNRKLMETIQHQQEKNKELNRVVEQQIKTQKELNEQKMSAIRQLEALNSRRSATDMVDDMIGKSLNELINRHMIHEDKSQRSVAADTRHLEQTLQRSDKAMKQVRSDFFPYVYSRAEKIFVEQLAGTYLKDALFAHNDERRNDAHLLLNTQIHKYNEMRGKKPSMEA